MISRILVATDGSEVAWKSVGYAAELAKQTGATLIVLTVIDRSLFLTQAIPAPAAPAQLIEPVEDFLRQTAEAYIKKAERICTKKGVKPQGVIKSGRPVDEIVKQAEKSKVDLIVMGSRGRSAIKAAVLGSVTYGVINKDTKIPILVVRR